VYIFDRAQRSHRLQHRSGSPETNMTYIGNANDKATILADAKRFFLQWVIFWTVMRMK
jgi:hypothetical protein